MMKRTSAILLPVALGALATGIGVVPFLVLANQDRDALNAELTKTKEATERIMEEKETIADQANKKVSEANAEIQKAQNVLQEVQRDQQLLISAKKIEEPKPYVISRWTSVVSLALGIQFSIPQGSYTDMDDPSGISIARGTTGQPSVRWMDVSPFDQNKKDRLAASLSNASPETLLIRGRLFTGASGTLDDDSRAMYLEARESGTSTHLIWIRDLDALERNRSLDALLGSIVIRPPIR